jgi:hypothetical protein
MSSKDTDRILSAIKDTGAKIRAEIKAELNKKIEQQNARFEQQNIRFEQQNVRFEQQNSKLEKMNNKLQLVFEKLRQEKTATETRLFARQAGDLKLGKARSIVEPKKNSWNGVAHPKYGNMPNSTENTTKRAELLKQKLGEEHVARRSDTKRNVGSNSTVNFGAMTNKSVEIASKAIGKQLGDKNDASSGVRRRPKKK